MFKHAYVRGVQNALIQSGHIAFPDEDNAAKVADYIAERTPFDPLTGQVSREVTASVATALVDASNYYRNQGVKCAQFQKVASVDDLGMLAHRHSLHLMEKAAEGSTIEGGDKGNAEPATGEGKMDVSNRPAGYAEGSRGSTEVNTAMGEVGTVTEQPNKQTNSPMGTNSLEDKSASLAQLIAKVAEGSTILGGDKGNDTPATGEGKMDAANRPEGYATLANRGDLGAMMALFNSDTAVGKELPHPNVQSESPSGTNSMIQTSQKSAAEDPYITVFKKTAAEVATYLPRTMSDDVKIAHVRACMGMNTEEKAHYLHGLQKEAADRTAPKTLATAYQGYNGKHANQKAAGEMPDFIQAKIDARKDEKNDKDSDKGDDKSESKNDSDKKDDSEKKDDEKSASLANIFRRISSSIQV